MGLIKKASESIEYDVPNKICVDVSGNLPQLFIDDRLIPAVIIDDDVSVTAMKGLATVTLTFAADAIEVISEK